MEQITYQERYASHPRDVKNYGRTQLRDEFIIEKIYQYIVKAMGTVQETRFIWI